MPSLGVTTVPASCMNRNAWDTCKTGGASQVPLTLHIDAAARTPLGTQLDAKILQPFFYQHLRTRSMQKPILVITITDGGKLLHFRVLPERSSYLDLTGLILCLMQSQRRSLQTGSTQLSATQRRCGR